MADESRSPGSVADALGLLYYVAAVLAGESSNSHWGGTEHERGRVAAEILRQAADRLAAARTGGLIWARYGKRYPWHRLVRGDDRSPSVCLASGHYEITFRAWQSFSAAYPISDRCPRCEETLSA